MLIYYILIVACPGSSGIHTNVPSIYSSSDICTVTIIFSTHCYPKYTVYSIFLTLHALVLCNLSLNDFLKSIPV